MFSQIFFILLTLVLISLIPETGLNFWLEDPNRAFLWGIGGYLGLFVLLFVQSKYLARMKKGWLKTFWWPLINLEIILFLSIYHFGLGAQRFFLQGPFKSYHSPYTLASLILYFLAMGWAHLWTPYFQLQRTFKNALNTSYQELLFLFPFCLPFVGITLLSDGFNHFLSGEDQTGLINQDAVFWGLEILFLCLIFIVFPAFVMICWRCRPLDRLDLQERLEKRCSSLHFRHAGLKIWSLMPRSFTAGIIGIVPWFRYILFTPALLNHFEPEEIEAILIHEIGHHHYRHLLYYPLIMLGMVVYGTLLLIGIENLFYFDLDPSSQEMSHFVVMMGLFIFYALFMGLYFRFIFGFFSRLFERQADLHIFATSLSPTHLIQALDHLGIVTGYTHSHPNWHHFGLQERILFLSQAIQNPSLIQKHHRRVKRWLIGYLLALTVGCFLLYQLI